MNKGKVYYPLPDLLMNKLPYQNARTKEIAYMNMYELFVKNRPVNPHEWIIIEDTQLTKVLYGSKKTI